MADREHLDRFLDEAGQYAATVKGALLGGATAVAVAVVEVPEEGAGDWAVTPVGRTFPVLADIASGEVACAATPEDRRRLVREHVEPSMRLV